MKRVLSIALLLALAAIGVISYGPPTPKIVHAQFVGATNVPGFAFGGVNGVVPTAAPTLDGNVTNPAVNFIVLVNGGPVFCAASEQMMAQSTLTLQASTTYQIEWNCGSELLYAKTAVTGPGTSPTTGLPATVLAPIPGVEIPLATVVCGATACGNTNGSITDARPLANFPGAGTPLMDLTFANLPTSNVTNGTIVFCTTCAVATAPCTGASTGALAIRVNATWRCQ